MSGEVTVQVVFEVEGYLSGEGWKTRCVEPPHTTHKSAEREVRRAKQRMDAAKYRIVRVTTLREVE